MYTGPNRKRNRAISGQLRSISELGQRGLITALQKGQLKEWVIQGDRRALEFLNLQEDDILGESDERRHLLLLFVCSGVLSKFLLKRSIIHAICGICSLLFCFPQPRLTHY